MSLLILSASDVSEVATKLSPDTLMSLMALVFVRATESSKDQGQGQKDQMPLRTNISTSNYTALFMPARMDEVGTSVKVVSVPKIARASGLPATTLVLDEESGAVKAVVNASSLTALRNAAGSALATKILGPCEPQVLLAFGAGKQIEAHVDILIRIFTTLKRCIIINRSQNARLEKLHSTLQTRYPQVRFTVGCAVDGAGQRLFDLEDAVASADIICTATSSVKPLFKAGWVKSGAHINLIGSYTPQMTEVEEGLIRRTKKVLVDSREACACEAGDLINAGVQRENMTEIGEVTTSDGKGTTDKIADVKSAGDVSIFKSVGIGLQDTAITNLIIENAISANIGTWVAYDEQSFS